MVSETLRKIAKLIDIGFRLEILFFVAIFGTLLGYLVYGQLLPVVSQLMAIVGGSIVGIFCAAVVGYLAMQFESP